MALNLPTIILRGGPSEYIRRKLIAAFTVPLPAAECSPDNACSICLEPFKIREDPAASSSGSSTTPLTTTTTTTAAAAAATATTMMAIKPTVCGHAAHFGCLLEWTAQASNCPSCKQQMFVGPNPNQACQTNPERRYVIPCLSTAVIMNENVWVGGEEDAGDFLEIREYWDEEAVDDGCVGVC